MIVPQYYKKAKTEGASAEALSKLVESHCLRAIQADAERKGQPQPQEVEPSVVSLTINMYEYALGKENA